MGCGRSSLPAPDSPGRQGDQQRDRSGGGRHHPEGGRTVPPSSLKGPPSPVIPLYDDPFSFFTPTTRIFDNSKDRSGSSPGSGGILGLMEGLAVCRKGGLRPAHPNEKALPTPQETAKISDSQIDFFKMLDQRIESGPDDESCIDSHGRVYMRSTSSREGEPSHPPHRRWSASKITNPRTPTSPQEPKFAFIRCEKVPHRKSHNFTEEDEENEDECLLDPTSIEATEGWSPSEAVNGEPLREQYMFLGNVYTVTRPRTVGGLHGDAARGSSSGVGTLVAVTPATATEEDLHEWEENGNCSNEKLLGGETTPECEVEQFWMELEINDPADKNEKQTLKIMKPRTKKVVTSDIVRPGLLPLRTVIE